MKKEIKIVVKIKEKFISVNNLYRPRLTYVNGRPKAITYKNPDAKRVETLVRDQLRAIDFTEYLDFLKNTKQFSLLIQFIFKNNVSRKDSSNYLKNLEDIWTRFVRDDLGINSYDDRLHTEVHCYKSVIPGSDEEMACIQIKESNFNTRIDKIEVPEKILLRLPDYPKGLKTSWSKEKIYLDPNKKGYNTDLWIIQDPLTPMQSSIVIKSLVEHQGSGYCIVVTDPKNEQVFKPFIEGHSNLVLTTMDDLLPTIKKLRGDETSD